MSITILIVDDEENARKNIGEFLSNEGYEIIEAANLAEARENLNHGNCDIVLLDVLLPDGYGPNLLDEIALFAYKPPIILITAFGDIEMAVDAMKKGANDFLEKPIDLNQLKQLVQRSEEIVTMRRELAHFRAAQQQTAKFIVGKSSQLKMLVEQAAKAASASVSVLITGETGTGKEVLARYIHQIGPRATKPFIAINCAAIQNTMLESELFGYEAGAFTGADKKKLGLMEVADGGILFLDEISSMDVDIQAKLLRAIDEQAFRRLGGTKLTTVDVQILAASNRDLKKMISEGTFREDLYYRLKVVDLDLPSLRDRKADIPELVAFIVRQLNAKKGMNITDISQNAMFALMDYDWPGNIRELSNAIERAMIFCDGETIDIQHLPADVVNH